MAAILDPRRMCVRRSSRIALVHGSSSSSSTATKPASPPPKLSITTTTTTPPHSPSSRKRSRTTPISPIPIVDPRLTPRALRALKRQRLSPDSNLGFHVAEPCLPLSPRSNPTSHVNHRRKRKENTLEHDAIPVRNSQPVGHKHAEATHRMSPPPQPSPLSPKHTFASSADENTATKHAVSLSSETRPSSPPPTVIKPPSITPETTLLTDVSTIPSIATQSYVTYTTLFPPPSSTSPSPTTTSFSQKSFPSPVLSSSTSPPQASCTPADSSTLPHTLPLSPFPGHSTRLDPWTDVSDNSKDGLQRHSAIDVTSSDEVRSGSTPDALPGHSMINEVQNNNISIMECEQTPPLPPDRDVQILHREREVQRERDREVNIWKLACQERVELILRRYGVDTIKAIVALEARGTISDLNAGLSATPTLNTRFRLYTPTSYTYGSHPHPDDDDADAEGEADTDCKYEYGIGYRWDCDYDMSAVGDKSCGEGVNDDDFDEDYDCDEEFDDEEYEGEGDELPKGSDNKPGELSTGENVGQPRALTLAQDPRTEMDIDSSSTSSSSGNNTTFDFSLDFGLTPSPFGSFSQRETSPCQKNDNVSNTSTSTADSTSLIQRTSSAIGPGTPPSSCSQVQLPNPYMTPRIPPVPPLSSLSVRGLSEPTGACVGRGTPPDRQKLMDWANATGRFKYNGTDNSDVSGHLSPANGADTGHNANESMDTTFNVVNPAPGEWTSFLHSLLAPSPSPSPSPPLGSHDLDVGSLPLSLQLPSPMQLSASFQIPSFPLSPSFQLPFQSSSQLVSDQSSSMFSLSTPSSNLVLPDSHRLNWFELGVPIHPSESSSDALSNAGGSQSHSSSTLSPAALPTPNPMIPPSLMTQSSCASASGAAIEDSQRESSTLRFALG